MTNGKLYGVGVGPGAPDLMTLRAVRILKEVPVIAIPRATDFSKGVAWGIAQPILGDIPDQERLFLTFPMTKDPEILLPAWEKAFAQIGERLEAGKDVAFIAEGDPMVYSSFIYLLNHAGERWPQVETEVVPAVSSITAAPALLGLPIVDGRETFAVIPASYGLEGLPEVLERFDTVIFTKVSAVMPQLVEILEEAGLLEQSVYVSKATMKGEKIVRDLKSIKNDKCDYFSVVITARKTRSGILAGRVDAGKAKV